jgi:hypothetical protein
LPQVISLQGRREHRKITTKKGGEGEWMLCDIPKLFFYANMSSAVEVESLISPEKEKAPP